jgi:hypothetical protein
VRAIRRLGLNVSSQRHWGSSTIALEEPPS